MCIFLGFDASATSKSRLLWLYFHIKLFYFGTLVSIVEFLFFFSQRYSTILHQRTLKHSRRLLNFILLCYMLKVAELVLWCTSFTFSGNVDWLIDINFGDETYQDDVLFSFFLPDSRWNVYLIAERDDTSRDGIIEPLKRSLKSLRHHLIVVFQSLWPKIRDAMICTCSADVFQITQHKETLMVYTSKNIIWVTKKISYFWQEAVKNYLSKQSRNKTSWDQLPF